MSRFDSLEFDERARPRRKKTIGTPVRNAAYFKKIADNHYRAGRFEPALQNYSRALEQDNSVFECWLGQLRSLINLGEYKEADIWARKALELFPERPELFAAQAIAAARMGLISDAMAHSDRAVEGKRASAFVWLARGEILLARKSKIFEHCFSQAIGLCPDAAQKAWMRVEIARTMRFYKRYALAISYAMEAVRALPREASVWIEIGRNQAELGLPNAAMSFRQALQIAPDNTEANRCLADFEGRSVWKRFRQFLRRTFRTKR